MASMRLFVALLICTIMCSTAFAAASPSITGVAPMISTTTTTMVTIMGDGFNALSGSEVVTIGSLECSIQSVDDTAIVCEAQHGFGQNIEVKIVDGTNWWSANVADFELATISPCVNYGDLTIVTGAPAVFITICGTMFGDDSGGAFTGNQEVVISGGLEATIVAHDDTWIVAELPTSGVGSKLPVRLVLGTQGLLVPEITVTFPQSVVTSVVVADGNFNKRSSYLPVIIYGYNFGMPGPLIHVTAWIGPFPCVGIRHISDTEIRCNVQGSGANMIAVVIVNGQSSFPTDITFGATAVRFDFPDPTTVGLTCVPPFGAVDVFATDMCNCWSGSAPSDNLLSTDCDVHAVCPGRLTTTTAVAESAPARPVTNFKDDKLWISQSIPIVKNRRDTIVQFVIPKFHPDAGTLGSQTCWYPGTIWSKKVNSLDCLDEFYGTLPWSQHDLCGFVEDTASNTIEYRYFVSNLVTTYTETFKKPDGSIHFRKISNAFLMTVSFRRQLTALTSTPVTVIIADEKATTSIDVTVDGDALYDVASKNTIISFVTTLVWPYQIHDTTLVAAWRVAAPGTTPENYVDAEAVLATIQPGELECDQVEDTDCEQAWVLTINTQPGANPQVCNLAGDVVFSTMALDCRDYTTVGACAESPMTNFTIVIGATDLCDDAPDVDASLGLATALETFYDAEFTIPQNVFQTGDMVYCQVSVTDPSSTIDRITFYNIKVSALDNSANDLLYAVYDPSNLQSWEYNTLAEFNNSMEFNTSGMILSPGSVGALSFNFRLLRDELNVVSTLASDNAQDMTKQLTISATIDLWYHGNQKRTLSLSSTNSIPAVAQSAISFFDMGLADEELEPHNNDQFAAVDDQLNLGFFSSASTVAVSVAAVVAVAALVLA